MTETILNSTMWPTSLCIHTTVWTLEVSRCSFQRNWWRILRNSSEVGGCCPNPRSGRKHVAQGGARLCERNPGTYQKEISAPRVL